MVATYPSELVAYSPDNNKLIHKNEKGAYIFTLDKEKEDHTATIGSKEIKNINSDVTDIRWVTDSINLYHKENNIVYFTDIDGENKTKLIEKENILGYTVENSRDFIQLITHDEAGVKITKYRIH